MFDKSLIVLLLCFTACAYAESEVLCPSVDKIHEAAQRMDNIAGWDKYGDIYSTRTQPFYEKDKHLSWKAFVDVFGASSTDAAIRQGGYQIAAVQFANQTYATISQDKREFTCTYSPANVTVIGHRYQ